MVELREKEGQIKFLIDGFPRSEGNVTAWKEVVGDAAVLEYVLFFECPYDILTSRLLERGKTSGRSDDSLVSDDGQCEYIIWCHHCVFVSSVCINCVYLSCSNTHLLFSKQHRMSFENDSTPTVKRVCQSLKCMKKRARFVRFWPIDQLKMCMQRWNPFLKTNDILGYSLHFNSVVVQWLLISCYLSINQTREGSRTDARLSKMLYRVPTLSAIYA